MELACSCTCNLDTSKVRYISVVRPNDLKAPGGRREIRGCTVEDEGLHSIYQSTCREGAHVV